MLVLALLPTTFAFTLQVSQSPSSDAVAVDPSFPNLSFEFASLYNFATTSANDSSPNEYSINLMHEVYKRTGGHPILRVGGTSGDFAIYVPNQEAAVTPIPGLGSNQDNGGTFFGPNFWPLTNNLESLNATWIPEISLANNNLSQVMLQAQAAMTGIKNIEAIELGNEPDLYPNGMSTVNWSAPLNDSSYVARFKEYAMSISNTTIWQGIDYSIAYQGLNVSGAYQDGINSTGLLKQISGHYYQNVNNDDSFASLLNHSRTVSQMERIQSWLNYTPNVIIDEVNTLSGPTNVTFQQSLGAAVWKVDFMLYCMSIGIKSVHWESVYNSNQAMWKPWSDNTSAAFTGSGYYSLLPAADFLAGPAKVQQLVSNDTFTAYASYHGTRLVRVALVNLNAWSGTSDRPNVTVSLTGLRKSKIKVEYLDCPTGAACPVANMTYAGRRWTAEAKGLPTLVDGFMNINSHVTNGTFDVVVPATSVAIVSF